MDPSSIADMIGSKVHQSLNKLLSDLDNLISSRLSVFQRYINDSQKALSVVQVAKIEETPTTTNFKEKGTSTGRRTVWQEIQDQIR